MYLKAMLIFAAILVGHTDVLASNDSLNVEQVSKLADFKVLQPTYSNKQWEVEVKEPTNIQNNESVRLIQLNYFEKNGSFIFSVKQHKAIGYINKHEVTDIDVQRKTMETKIVEEEFKFSTQGEVVDLNGIEARFEAWVDNTPGGILRWVQNDTYIEINSKVLHKGTMIKLAKSMKPISK